MLYSQQECVLPATSMYFPKSFYFLVSLDALGEHVNFSYPKVRFECLKCALCCGDTKARARHILLLKKEVERISEATSKTLIEFAEKIEGHSPYVYEMRKTSQNGKCVFLKDSRCTIYQLRPVICRFYPFELKVTKDEEHEFSFTEECLGIRRGKMLKKRYFSDLIKQLRQSVE
jgi:Fe-S-cluster containining protein